MMRFALAAALVLAAGPALAQGPSLLDVAAQPRAAQERVRPPLTRTERTRVTVLAQLVAAELGPDASAPRVTRVGLAAAFLNYIEDQPWKYRTLSADEVHALRVRFPRLLAHGFDGDDGLHARSLEWLQQNGYGLSVEAALAALDGEDPTHGAIYWSDMFGPGDRFQPEGEPSAVLPSSTGALLFYVH